jgi:GntR family transcriptional repressor for pyruvate dehydrogenase complex
METRRELPPTAAPIIATQTRVSDIAEHYLKSLIFSGQLAPGDRLPPERELAAQLGISRITLRVALRSLEAAGFLVIKLGSKGGSRVNEATSMALHWQEWMKSHRHRLRQMLEFRRLIETEIAALAAARHTEEDLELLATVGIAPKEGELPLVRWHFGFHDALAKAAHNEYLEQAMQTIRGELFVPTDWVLTEHRVTEIEDVHKRIFDAVRDGDPDRAREEMAAHLDFSEKPFKAFLEE